MDAKTAMKYLMVAVSQHRRKGPLESSMALFQMEDGTGKMSFMLGPKPNATANIGDVVVSALAQMDEKVVAIAVVSHGPGEYGDEDGVDRKGYLYKMYAEDIHGNTTGVLAVEDDTGEKPLFVVLTEDDYDGTDIFPEKLLDRVAEAKASGTTQVGKHPVLKVDDASVYDMRDGEVKSYEEVMKDDSPRTKILDAGTEGAATEIMKKLLAAGRPNEADIKQEAEELLKMVRKYAHLLEGASGAALPGALSTVGMLQSAPFAEDNVPMSYKDYGQILDAGVLMVAAITLTYSDAKMMPPMMKKALSLITATMSVTGRKIMTSPMAPTKAKAGATTKPVAESDSGDWQ